MIEPNINNYGFGWGIFEESDNIILQHLGSMPSSGSYSCIQINREKKYYVAMLSNYGLPDVLKICNTISDIINNKSIDTPKRPIKSELSINQLSKYEGSYKGFLNFTITVELDNLCIVFDFGDETIKKIDLYYPIGNNRFANVFTDQQIDFEIDKNNNVSLWGISKEIM